MNTAPEVEPTPCTRKEGHDGPCNGWPCDSAKAKRTAPEACLQMAQSANPPLLPATADEIRSKIVEQFTTFQPHMKAYADYAERIAALSLEYHDSRLGEVLGIPIEVGVLMAALDARETPKSLDGKLAQIEKLETPVRRIIFDRSKSTYYLFM